MLVATLIAVVFVLFASYGVFSGAVQSIAASISGDGTNMSKLPANLPVVSGSIVATDPATWPKGNRLWDCCRAVAVAEGYGIPGANPTVLNNPGDISDGSNVYGAEYHSGSNITKFPSAQLGWQWLYAKLANIVNGVSTVYDVSYSWREIGAKWAPPNAEVWASNVASALGVDPDSSIGDYVNG
jgi:hypothetical protein